MRLKEVSKILKDNVDKLNIPQTPISGTQNVKVANLNLFRNAINNIEETGLFKGEINQIKTTDAYASTIDLLTLPSSQYNHLYSLANYIKTGATTFINGVNENISLNYSDNVISIKLPNKLDLGELAKTIELLKKSLSIPLADSEINDTIEINSFESGSFWIDVLVHSTEAVALIAAIAWAGAFINKQYLETKIHWAYIDSLQNKNEHLKDLREASKKQLDLLVEAEAQNLQATFYTGEDSERIQRLTLSIECMSKLIEKGTEIHPNLLASESLKNSFPSFKNLNLIESKTKQIKNE